MLVCANSIFLLRVKVVISVIQSNRKKPFQLLILVVHSSVAIANDKLHFYDISAPVSCKKVGDGLGKRSKVSTF